jgi:hypothetical protein
MKASLWSLLLAFLLSLSPCTAQEQVDLELVLLADASGSIDDDEIAFQRQGYAEAVTHPDVLAAITSGLTGKIAVTYVEWGAANSQHVVVPWMLVSDAASAKSFADALLPPPREAFGRNAIGTALTIAQGLIEQNQYDGVRKVIDLSADSANSWDGIPIDVARKSILDAGMTINGLAVLCRICSGRPVSYDLEKAFEEKIIGGPESFVITADDERRFATAVRNKLILEIAGRDRAPRSLIEMLAAR